MQNNRPPHACVVLLATLCLLSGAAAAQSTAEQLSQIENDTLVLKAQERQMAVKLQLANQQAELNARHSDSGRAAAQPGRGGDPTIVSIEGIGEKLYATLMMANGASIEVQSGETLPNGMRVLSIRANEVLVQGDKKQRIRLASGAPAAAPPSAPAANPRQPFILPPLPPGMLNGPKGSTP
ncbi:MAG: type IV pilus biogenesis protein PilP [Pseudomonadota bacterium]